MKVGRITILAAAISASSFGATQPDFSLVDVNRASVRYGVRPVSPRDYVMQISGYYFGHSD